MSIPAMNRSDTDSNGWNADVLLRTMFTTRSAVLMWRCDLVFCPLRCLRPSDRDQLDRCQSGASGRADGIWRKSWPGRRQVSRLSKGGDAKAGRGHACQALRWRSGPPLGLRQQRASKTPAKPKPDRGSLFSILSVSSPLRVRPHPLRFRRCGRLPQAGR